MSVGDSLARLAHRREHVLRVEAPLADHRLPTLQGVVIIIEDAGAAAPPAAHIGLGPLGRAREIVHAR